MGTVINDEKFRAWLTDVTRKRIASHVAVEVANGPQGQIRARINGSIHGALTELECDLARAAHAALVFVENVRDHGVYAEAIEGYTTFRDLKLLLARVLA